MTANDNTPNDNTVNDDYANDTITKSALADAAIICRPRLFAIHGLYKRRETGTILGWGMQFPDGQGAVYTDPETRTTHSASTAENLLLHLRVVGDVELTWLTSDAQ